MKYLSITGHLGDDAELLEKKENDYYTIMFSMAHSEVVKQDKEGNDVTQTDWITCFKRYRKDPKKVLDILKKGSKIFVDGKPNFGMNTSAKGGVFMSITLNVNNLDFMSKKPETPKKG